MNNSLMAVIVPVGIGITVRTKCKPQLADRLVSLGSFVGFMFIFIIISAYLADPANRGVLQWIPTEAHVATIMLGTVGCIMGYVSSRFIAGEEPRQMR